MNDLTEEAEEVLILSEGGEPVGTITVPFEGEYGDGAELVRKALREARKRLSDAEGCFELEKVMGAAAHSLGGVYDLFDWKNAVAIG